MLPTRDPPQNKRLQQTESKELEKIFQENGQEQKARVPLFILDKIDFKKEP